MHPLVMNWRIQDKMFVISRKCYVRMFSHAVLNQVFMLFLSLYSNFCCDGVFTKGFSYMLSLNCSLEGEPPPVYEGESLSSACYCTVCFHLGFSKYSTYSICVHPVVRQWHSFQVIYIPI